MTGAARLTDRFVGVCLVCNHTPDHSGAVITASENVTNNYLGVARHDDIVRATCGHTGTIIATGNPLVNGRKIALLGDSVVGDIQGVLVTASSDFGEQ